MTVRKVKSCQCTHADYHHAEKGKGRCEYGKDTPFGGCTCPRFRSRRRGHTSTGLGNGIDIERLNEKKIAEVRRAGEAAGIAMGVEPSPAARAAAAAMLAPSPELVALADQILALARAVEGLQSTVSALAAIAGASAPSEMPAPLPRVTAPRFDVGREMAARVAAERPKVIADSVLAARKAAGAATTLGKCERALLGTLLASWPHTMRVEALAVCAGYSLTSSSFENGLSALRSAELIDGPRSALGASTKAVGGPYHELGSKHPLPKNLGDAAARASAKLAKAERYILDVIGMAAARREAPLSRETIGERAGYSVTSSSFENALSRLRTLALIRGNGRAGNAITLGPALEGFVQ